MHFHDEGVGSLVIIRMDSSADRFRAGCNRGEESGGVEVDDQWTVICVDEALKWEIGDGLYTG